MIEFFAGLLAGAAVVIGWVLTLDEDAEPRRRAELLRQSMNALERYGESRHLAATIRRELADEAGA